MEKKVNYEIKENNNGMLKTVVTQEVEIDLSTSVKNIIGTRAEFAKAFASIYEMASAMEYYIKQHDMQNEFLENVENSILVGGKYQMPKLVSPFDSKLILEELNKFKKEETERRLETIAEVKQEQKAAEPATPNGVTDGEPTTSDDAIDNGEVLPEEVKEAA